MNTDLTTVHTRRALLLRLLGVLGLASVLAACKHTPGGGGFTVEPQGDSDDGGGDGGQDAGGR